MVIFNISCLLIVLYPCNWDVIIFVTDMWKLFTLDLGYNDIFATYIFIKKKKVKGITVFTMAFECCITGRRVLAVSAFYIVLPNVLL